MPQVSDTTTSKTHPKPWHLLHVVYAYKQVTTQRNNFNNSDFWNIKFMIDWEGW